MYKTRDLGNSVAAVSRVPVKCEEILVYNARLVHWKRWPSEHE